MFLDSELISDGCIDFRIMNNVCLFGSKDTITEKDVSIFSRYLRLRSKSFFIYNCKCIVVFKYNIINPLQSST